MKSYPPTHADPRSSFEPAAPPAGYEIPTDATLIRYVERYWQELRAVVEQHFGEFASALALYSNYPYCSTIVRLGDNGVIIAHAPSASATVQVRRPDDFAPPLENFNLFHILERLCAQWSSFDFTFKSYSEDDARRDGTSIALDEALGVFWRVLEPARFEGLCNDLLVAEGVRLRPPSPTDNGVDVSGLVYLHEPGNFIREEEWGFQLKHSTLQRPSAALVREAEIRAAQELFPFDVLCLVSSGDMTSIGHTVVVDSPSVRVWDRPVLDRLLHRHPDVLKRYFELYAHALEQLQTDHARRASVSAKLKATLNSCPPGQKYFREYEDWGAEVLRFLFPVELGSPHVQPRTADGVERRDVVCRNNRVSRFFQRVGDRFDADFVIFDFKNYADEITGQVVNDVSMYANAAIGRLIVIVSRQGGGSSARAAQLRRLRNDSRMILVLSDEQVLEMLRRKESELAPEDVLEDLLDELLLAN